MAQRFRWEGIDVELYCKLFIDSMLDKRDIESAIIKHFAGRFDGFTIICNWAEIDVQKNEEWDPERTSWPAGFLYSKFYADVTPVDGVERLQYITELAKIVRLLRERECLVVPSCDFEEDISALS